MGRETITKTLSLSSEYWEKFEELLEDNEYDTESKDSFIIGRNRTQMVMMLIDNYFDSLQGRGVNIPSYYSPDHTTTKPINTTEDYKIAGMLEMINREVKDSRKELKRHITELSNNQTDFLQKAICNRYVKLYSALTYAFAMLYRPLGMCLVAILKLNKYDKSLIQRCEESAGKSFDEVYHSYRNRIDNDLDGEIKKRYDLRQKPKSTHTVNETEHDQ